MKKPVAVLLALTMSAAFTSTAFAGVTLEDYRALEDRYTSWVYRTNLLYSTEDFKTEKISDVDGNVLSSNVYSDVRSAMHGKYLVVEKDNGSFNNKGICDLSCTELVPCSYADIDVLNRHWIVGTTAVESTADNYDENLYLYDADFNQIYALIDTVDLYYVKDDGSVSKVGSLPRENYLRAEEHANFILIEDRATGKLTLYDSSFQPVQETENAYDIDVQTDEITIFRINGQYGVKAPDGSVLVEPQYDYIYGFKGGYAKAEKNDLYGLIDETGTLVIPCEWEDILYSYSFPVDQNSNYTDNGFNAFGYFAIEQNGMLGYINADNTVTCQPTLASANLDNNGCSATYTGMDGSVHILAADGTDTDVSSYSSVRVMSGSAGMLYEVNDDDYNTGVIDWHGAIVVPLENGRNGLSGDGQYLIEGANIKKVTYHTDDAAAGDVSADAAADAGNEGNAAADQTADPAADQAGTAADQTADPAADQTGTAADQTDAGSTSEFSIILNTVLSLADAGMDANKPAIQEILTSIVNTTGSETLKAMISSAKALLDAETVDTESFKLLISGAIAIAG